MVRRMLSTARRLCYCHCRDEERAAELSGALEGMRSEVERILLGCKGVQVHRGVGRAGDVGASQLASRHRAETRLLAVKSQLCGTCFGLSVCLRH